jgi:hypothetical protein
MGATSASMLIGAWPRQFPYHVKLDRLIKTGDPEIGYFALATTRHEALCLWKALFGPKGSRDTPKGAGARTRVLTNGWRVQFEYEEPGDIGRAGKATIEFYPPELDQDDPTPVEEEIVE